MMRDRRKETGDRSQGSGIRNSVSCFLFPVSCLLITVSCILLPVSCFAQALSSAELISNAKEYDGKLIDYSGEVIGDVMSRGESAWVNINDGQNALGVWMSGILAKEIKFTGNYKARGDRLEIVGVFHRACIEHGGDLDIHAQTLLKVTNGRLVKENLNFDKVILSLILLGVLFLIWILTLFKRK